MATIIVEVAVKKNRNPIFPPTGQRVRGRWSKAENSHASMHRSIAALPDIPGLYIAIDTVARKLGVLDPLNDPRHAETWNTFVKIQQENPEHINAMRRADDVNLEDASDTDIKTWVYWVRRWIDSGKCVSVHGSVPGWEELREMPGDALNDISVSGSESRATDKRAISRRPAMATAGDESGNRSGGKK